MHLNPSSPIDLNRKWLRLGAKMSALPAFGVEQIISGWKRELEVAGLVGEQTRDDLSVAIPNEQREARKKHRSPFCRPAALQVYFARGNNCEVPLQNAGQSRLRSGGGTKGERDAG